MIDGVAGGVPELQRVDVGVPGGHRGADRAPRRRDRRGRAAHDDAIAAPPGHRARRDVGVDAVGQQELAPALLAPHRAVDGLGIGGGGDDVGAGVGEVQRRVQHLLGRARRPRERGVDRGPRPALAQRRDEPDAGAVGEQHRLAQRDRRLVDELAAALLDVHAGGEQADHLIVIPRRAVALAGQPVLDHQRHAVALDQRLPGQRRVAVVLGRLHPRGQPEVLVLQRVGDLVGHQHVGPAVVGGRLGRDVQLGLGRIVEAGDLLGQQVDHQLVDVGGHRHQAPALAHRGVGGALGGRRVLVHAQEDPGPQPGVVHDALGDRALDGEAAQRRDLGGDVVGAGHQLGGPGRIVGAGRTGGGERADGGDGEGDAGPARRHARTIARRRATVAA
ncbi:MAG: hypothetical protein IPH44_23800 [Myxococcales bacterium]|nr:hypothetical protein [Myxococcales bacterium]